MQPAINGKQIVELCENRQINLFVIKTVYIKWQEEANNIRSSFFDYSAPEVTQAMTSLMNVLSRYISVRQATFEPILANAVADTLLLTLSPYDYYAKEFAMMGKEIEVNMQVKTIAKYFKVHKKLFDKILAQLEAEGNTIKSERAAAIVAAILGQNPELDNQEALLLSFDKVIPLNFNNLFVTQEANRFANTQLEETTFDISPLRFDLNLKEEKPIVTEYVPTPVVTQKPVEQIVEEKFSPLSNPELARSIMANSQQQSMRNIIPFEKRNGFVSMLFNGNSSEFDDALGLIDRCSDYHEAIMIIKDRYFRKYSWDLEKDEVKEFYEMVSEKFD
ncbi:MAG: hypothetical protein EAZ08_09200 [Cytophagales bacterium]|nr:MAG: hypothetical protein EAZ08_09200 [Cytophagales bacterium]